MVKNHPAMQETGVWSLGWEDPLEKEMATHSSILAWKIPWTEEPGRLQSMGSQRVGHDWVTELNWTELNDQGCLMLPLACLNLGQVSSSLASFFDLSVLKAFPHLKCKSLPGFDWFYKQGMSFSRDWQPFLWNITGTDHTPIPAPVKGRRLTFYVCSCTVVSDSLQPHGL